MFLTTNEPLRVIPEHEARAIAHPAFQPPRVGEEFWIRTWTIWSDELAARMDDWKQLIPDDAPNRSRSELSMEACWALQRWRIFCRHTSSEGLPEQTWSEFREELFDGLIRYTVVPREAANEYEIDLRHPLLEGY